MHGEVTMAIRVRCTIYSTRIQTSDGDTNTKSKIETSTYKGFVQLEPLDDPSPGTTHQVTLYSSKQCNDAYASLVLCNETTCGLDKGKGTQSTKRMLLGNQSVELKYHALITEHESWMFQAHTSRTGEIEALEKWFTILSERLEEIQAQSWSLRVIPGSIPFRDERMTLFVTDHGLSICRANPPVCVTSWPLIQCPLDMPQYDTQRQLLTLRLPGQHDQEEFLRFCTSRSLEISDILTQRLKKAHQEVQDLEAALNKVYLTKIKESMNQCRCITQAQSPPQPGNAPAGASQEGAAGRPRGISISSEGQSVSEGGEGQTGEDGSTKSQRSSDEGLDEKYVEFDLNQLLGPKSLTVRLLQEIISKIQQPPLVTPLPPQSPKPKKSKKKRPASRHEESDKTTDYMDISQTLCAMLERRAPQPDTLQLCHRMRKQLCCRLYSDNQLTKDWTDLAEHIGLSWEAIAIIKGFIAEHRVEVTAAEIVLRHWQSMHNRHKRIPGQIAPPVPCTRPALEKMLANKLERHDLADMMKTIDICPCKRHARLRERAKWDKMNSRKAESSQAIQAEDRAENSQAERTSVTQTGQMPQFQGQLNNLNSPGQRLVDAPSRVSDVMVPAGLNNLNHPGQRPQIPPPAASTSGRAGNVSTAAAQNISNHGNITMIAIPSTRQLQSRYASTIQTEVVPQTTQLKHH